MRYTIIIVCSLGILLTGCASLRPISSKPPESKIVMKSPVKVHSALLDTATFPAGEYRPLYEDDGGYYYQASAKVIVHSAGIVTYLFDGGIYVKRGDTEPTDWYFIDQSGMKTMRSFFGTTLACELVP
jgi:hypothetical protein